VPFPTITETHGAFTCGWSRNLPHGAPIPPAVFVSMADEVVEDPGWFTSTGLPALPSYAAAAASLTYPTETLEEVPGAVPNSDH
jgi:hypothetical protein